MCFFLTSKDLYFLSFDNVDGYTKIFGTDSKLSNIAHTNIIHKSKDFDVSKFVLYDEALIFLDYNGKMYGYGKNCGNYIDITLDKDLKFELTEIFPEIKFHNIYKTSYALVAITTDKKIFLWGEKMIGVENPYDFNEINEWNSEGNIHTTGQFDTDTIAQIEISLSDLGIIENLFILTNTGKLVFYNPQWCVLYEFECSYYIKNIKLIHNNNIINDLYLLDDNGQLYKYQINNKCKILNEKIFEEFNVSCVSLVKGENDRTLSMCIVEKNGNLFIQKNNKFHFVVNLRNDVDYRGELKDLRMVKIKKKKFIVVVSTCYGDLYQVLIQNNKVLSWQQIIHDDQTPIIIYSDTNVTSKKIKVSC